jgi:hypothetical protein
MDEKTRTDRPAETERPDDKTPEAPSVVSSRPAVNWFGLALWIFGYAAYPRGEELKEVHGG